MEWGAPLHGGGPGIGHQGEPMLEEKRRMFKNERDVTSSSKTFYITEMKRIIAEARDLKSSRFKSFPYKDG